MGRTACTEPQCLYSTAIPLLPLWSVRTVQSLSACTVQLYLYSPYGPYGLYRASVSVQYSYTSTSPMGRTACTEPQCLYNGALYRYLLLIAGRNSISILPFSVRLPPIPQVSSLDTADNTHTRQQDSCTVCPILENADSNPTIVS